jgi:hypothetical protein
MRFVVPAFTGSESRFGISFQGRDKEQGGTTPNTIWTLESLFPSLEVGFTVHWALQSSPLLAALTPRGGGRSCDEESRDPRGNYLIFRCARDETYVGNGTSLCIPLCDVEVSTANEGQSVVVRGGEQCARRVQDTWYKLVSVGSLGYGWHY